MTQGGSMFAFHQDWWLQDIQSDTVESLSSQLSVSQTIARAMAGRGYDNPEEARHFIRPHPDQLHDPFRISDMDRAVGRILRAIDLEEKIVVYGHDDVDGITSALVLKEAVRTLGGTIETYIPDRVTEGIGLTWDNLNLLARKGFKLIVTVDCSTEDKRLLNQAEYVPIDVVVTDHHEVSRPFPALIPFVNPKRRQNTYPFRELSGVGVSFKVVQALFQERGGALGDFLEKHGDLVALGTLSDKVLLLNENRIFSKLGFDLIRSRPRAGFRAILNLIDEPKSINQDFVMRRIIPILSSAASEGGRNDGLTLLETSDEEQARVLARALSDRSRQWQSAMKESFERILQDTDTKTVLEEDVVAVIDDETPLTALGTCAAKLMREYKRPTFVLRFSEDHYVGEARAPRGWNLVELLDRCQDLLINYGGHKQAAGLSIFPEYLTDFQDRLKVLSKEVSQPGHSVRRLDAELNPSDIDQNILDELMMFMPFGRGNPSPLFLGRNVTLTPAQGEEKNGSYVGMVSGIPVFIPPYLSRDVWMEKQSSDASYDIIYHISLHDEYTPHLVLNDFKRVR